MRSCEQVPINEGVGTMIRADDARRSRGGALRGRRWPRGNGEPTADPADARGVLESPRGEKVTPAAGRGKLEVSEAALYRLCERADVRG
jgi:hypothetical protein